eukprot:scaffold2529_cov363-Prasinococcus_capsulatus_cf.AAC.21
MKHAWSPSGCALRVCFGMSALVSWAPSCRFIAPQTPLSYRGQPYVEHCRQPASGGAPDAGRC